MVVSLFYVLTVKNTEKVLPGVRRKKYQKKQETIHSHRLVNHHVTEHNGWDFLHSNLAFQYKNISIQL